MADMHNIVSLFDRVCSTHCALECLEHLIENDQISPVFSVINAQMSQNLAELGDMIESFNSDSHVKNITID